MPYFPQLTGGVTVQRPYAVRQTFTTTKNDMDSGARFAYAWRVQPLGRFQVELSSVTDADAATLRTFFASMRGRLGEFAFLDPAGNLVAWSEDLARAVWEKYTAATAGATADPFGGSRAIVVAGSSGNSMLASYVLPDGNASGFVLCGSVWVKPASSGSLHIGFVDSGFSLLGGTTWPLQAGQWRRIWHTITLGTNSPVRLLIGGLGTWGATTLALFGAQCSPQPGPGAYARTPGREALRAKCRFDTDIFEARRTGRNQNAITLPIVEFA